MLLKLLLFILVVRNANCAKESSCDTTDTNLEEVAKWANNLKAIKDQDQKRSQVLKSFLAEIWPNDRKIRQTFYEFLSQPMQTVCSIPKKIGGNWLQQCGWFDGEKHVCMDNLKSAIDKNECLVYSFGLGSHWEFEMTMAEMGCTVRAFDPTVKKVPREIDLNKIHFVPFGLGPATGESKVVDNERSNKKSLVKVLTLEDAIKYFKDEGKTIHYLKVDVEGHELKSIPKWLTSGVLENIQQINLELHTGKLHIKEHQITSVLKPLLTAFSEMDKKYGFKTIDYKPNGCVNKWQDGEKRYFTFFDIVLMKQMINKP